MSTYLISYDLQKEIKDYPKLYEAIKSYKNWAHVLDSVWLIKTEINISILTNNLRLFIDSNDKLLVMDVSNDPWMAYSLEQEVSNWMQAL